MRPLNKILVGVDFSEASKAALIEADYIALWEGGELHVVHVIAIDEADSILKMAAPGEEVFEGMLEKLKTFTEEATNLCEKRVYHVCFGNPFEQMMALLETTSSNLLVVGSHGGSDKSNHVGAIASKCARRSEVPVLLVRRPHDVGYKKLVVCVNFSGALKAAVEYAAEIACNENAKLHILHVWCDPWGAYAFPVEGLNYFMIERQLEEAKTAAQKKIKKMRAALMHEYFAANISTSVVEAPSVIKGIIDFINENKDMDLVVVGNRGQSKLSEFFIGTTTERLIQKSPCSVLTVGAPDEK
jgi:nucleotide-binding universal stress UspA family protein|tara:strand:- start:6522 stop:7421 length:900 start_codon:yes stop_codon:yes gene_type:complete